MRLGNPEKTGIIRDEKGRFPKGVSGNPLGKPEGTVSLVTDIKNRLIYIKEHKPEKYQSIIDDYWMDRNKRELLIKIVEPGALAPQTQVAIQNNVNIGYTSLEDAMPSILEAVGDMSEEQKDRVRGCLND